MTLETSLIARNLRARPRRCPPCPLRHCALHSFNKYIQVAARATRQALKEEERVAAEKRGTITLKYQKWAEGKPSTAVSCFE